MGFRVGVVHRDFLFVFWPFFSVAANSKKRSILEPKAVSLFEVQTRPASLKPSFPVPNYFLCISLHVKVRATQHRGIYKHCVWCCQYFCVLVFWVLFEQRKNHVVAHCCML